MGILTTCARARNSNPLPLFDWAERKRNYSTPRLLMTSRLSRRFKTQTVTLDAWALANGYTCEGDNYES